LTDATATAREVTMPLPESSFLYALATVSITFVGFAALLIVFRQSVGRDLTAYDTYFALSFIQAGFITTTSGLIPPALALFGWAPPVVWRVSSVAFAVAILLFVAAVPGRRRAATRDAVPTFIRILLAVQTAAALSLLLTAVGVFERPAAVYGMAATTMLVSTGLAYVLALNRILPELHGAAARGAAPSITGVTTSVE
jgi:hypothetical protein